MSLVVQLEVLEAVGVVEQPVAVGFEGIAAD